MGGNKARIWSQFATQKTVNMVNMGNMDRFG